MNTFTKYFLLFSLLLVSYIGKAQVFPPDLLCVKGDSLFWVPTANPCGPFQAYTIYFSANENGPFTILETITDPNQTKYRHLNPTGQQWFYYMESDHNCPGEMVLQSDIIDNRSPAIAPIEGATIVGNDVRIEWTQSPSPEVHAYVIYRVTTLGTVPIDTVFAPTNFYLDTGANPTQQTEAYFILAVDECGNSSIFDVPHFTTYLQYSVDPCLRTINLSWNKYNSWLEGLGRQEVWFSYDSGPFNLIATLDSSVNTFIFEDALKGHLYSFYIQSYQNAGSFTASSNIIRLDPVLIQAVRDLDLKNVTVDGANEVQLNWTWNTDAEIKDLAILNAPQNSGYEIIDNLNPANPLQVENNAVALGIDAGEGSQFFVLQSSDLCDSVFQSNYASTIFISGTPMDDLTNALQWTPYNIEGGVVKDYELYRIVASQESLVEVIPDNENSFSDPVDPRNNAETNICYYVVANTEYELPDGTVQSLRSRSNTTCVQQTSTIFVPNAFVPSGRNSRFKPIVVFSENITYRMVILDRWGGKVFETSDLDEGWTGRKGLSLLPGGAYTYIIRVVQPDGQVIKKQGMVVLVR